MTVALCEEKRKLRGMDNMVEVFKGRVSVYKKSGDKNTKIEF